jgi:hypothetical protein
MDSDVNDIGVSITPLYNVHTEESGVIDTNLPWAAGSVIPMHYRVSGNIDGGEPKFLIF